MDRRLGFRLLRFGAGAFVRADTLVNRVSTSSRQAIGSLLSHALSPQEMNELSIWLYDRVPRRYVSKDLWSWERDWFTVRLPAPPARILVGAAGSGREAIALAKRGYRVDAFEPAAQMTAIAATALGEPHRVLLGNFEDLAVAVLDHGDSPLAPLATEQYDAVLLGWGALSHIIRSAERERIIAAAAALSPEGPILASFFLSVQPPRPGRAQQLGGAIGDRIARGRGVVERVGEIDFSTNLGFTYVFGKDELEALAAKCGRDLAWDPEPGFPHATFLPAP